MLISSYDGETYSSTFYKMASESITELASIIAINTAKVESYCALYNPPRPSFDVNAPSKSLMPPEEVEIKKARQVLLDATLKLHNLVLGPRDYIQSFLVIEPHSHYPKSIP